jgi:hypothetical protein
MQVLWRGTILGHIYPDTPSITAALQRGIGRVRSWDKDSSLRVKDIRDYLVWQLYAIGEGLDWYLDQNWLRKALVEHEPTAARTRSPLLQAETIDRKAEEIAKYTGLVLRNGRYDDWSEIEVEDVVLHENRRKRRRLH